METVIETEPSFSRQTPVALFPFNPAGFGAYDVSADGEQFLMLKLGAYESAPGSRAAEPQVIIVENWIEELQRLVPVD